MMDSLVYMPENHELSSPRETDKCLAFGTKFGPRATFLGVEHHNGFDTIRRVFFGYQHTCPVSLVWVCKMRHTLFEPYLDPSVCR